MSEHHELEFNTTPNRLSLVRILLVPLVVGCLWIRDPLWDFIGAIFFGIAGLTDYLDGYLARKHQVETVYGKLLDPLADKFLVICSYIILQDLGRINAFVVMILVCRELTITGLRALASAEGVIVSASTGGKWKTATQMAAIPMLMLHRPFEIPFDVMGMVLTYISLLLSLGSAKDYIVEFFAKLRLRRKKRKERKAGASDSSEP